MSYVECTHRTLFALRPSRFGHGAKIFRASPTAVVESCGT